MALNQEENACSDIKYDDECFVEENSDSYRKNLLDFDDYISNEGCEDITDLLPDDPFGMECNSSLPIDPFGMDFDVNLPRDPFGMDLNIEATVAAIAGWMETFGLKAYGFEADEASQGKNVDDNKCFAELNFPWTSSLKCEQEEGKNESVDVGLVVDSEDGSCSRQNALGGDVEELMFFGFEKYESKHLKGNNYADGGAPADALFFALGYLGVSDLLSVERVCKSLHEAVQNDPLLWRNIHIDYPLSDKITDDHLLQLTNRAQGSLHSLSLVKCLNITNFGLKQVLETNLGLTKLSMPGCTKLGVEDILHDLKAFNSVALPGIKRLRIGELSGLTNQHFKEFKLLLGANEDKKSGNYKPRFYRAGQLYLSLDDERPIDIETCPICEQARLVYDCPSENCQVKIHSTKTCRACIFCVARCIGCGCCLDNRAFEETFCLDLLCFDCLAQLFNCQDTVTLSPWHTYFRQRASYRFFFYS